MSEDDYLPDATVNATELSEVELRGNATTCVWCGKLCSVKEVDSHNRCEFDALFEFSDEGKALAATERGYVATWMVFEGIHI
jgi:hypothetical protein